MILQFYTAIWPVGGTSEDGKAYDFFKAYLALPVVLAFWVGGYFWKHVGWMKISQIDVDSGRREHDWERINGWKVELAAMPAWKRLFYFLF
jgi:amino acid transporter